MQHPGREDEVMAINNTSEDVPRTLASIEARHREDPNRERAWYGRKMYRRRLQDS